jgi:anti-sigma-K factor RskA
MSPDIHTLTGAYAVDALPADERRRFEEHLDVCEACRQEVAELQATAARLGDAEAIAPPPGMREAVLAQLDHVRQEPPRPAVTELVRGTRPRRWVTWTAGAAAAVATVVAIGLATVVADLNGRVDQLETATSQVSDVMVADDARVVEVPTGEGATARVVLAPSRNEAVLLVDGMPAAPIGHDLVLWLIDSEGTAEPAGTLTLDEDGRATRHVAGDLGATTAIGVTIEPEGQPATEPTTDPVMVADLTT